MKRCRNCVLPETFPGIEISDDGICSFCRDYKGEEHLEEQKERFRKKFHLLVNEYKGKSGYDALMCYSGGKDSTYTLYLLKEKYDLNVLTMTFDNGFLADQAIENIHKVTDKLGYDHILFRPSFEILRKIFVESSRKNIYSAQTLTRASTICTSCIAIVKFGALRTAVEKAIPMSVFGWSPGQIPISASIMKNNAKMTKVMQQTLYDPLYALAGDKIKPFFLEERHFSGTYDFPYNVSPLAFFDYNEEKIFQKIAELGWEAPSGIDANSTNCLINSFANILHKQQYGFHPYVFELAKMVREGYMERAKALEKLTEPENLQTVKLVKKKLKIE